MKNQKPLKPAYVEAPPTRVLSFLLGLAIIARDRRAAEGYLTELVAICPTCTVQAAA